MPGEEWNSLPVKSIDDVTAAGILWIMSKEVGSADYLRLVDAAKSMTELLERIDAWHRGERPVIALDLGNGDYDVAYFIGQPDDQEDCWEIAPFVRQHAERIFNSPSDKRQPGVHYEVARPAKIIRVGSASL